MITIKPHSSHTFCVNNHDEAERLQLFLFDLGYKWYSGKKLMFDWESERSYPTRIGVFGDRLSYWSSTDPRPTDIKLSEIAGLGSSPLPVWAMVL